jgi:hypothetical protein
VSEYPRLMYHPSGATATATSAHHERTAFEGWAREPSDVHRKDPGDGYSRHLTPTLPSVAPLVAPSTPTLPADPPGPASLGDIRGMIRDELAAHPGLNGDLQGLHAKIDALMASVASLAAGSEGETEGETEEGEGDGAQASPRRRGRRGSRNRLTGEAGTEAQE